MSGAHHQLDLLPETWIVMELREESLFFNYTHGSPGFLLLRSRTDRFNMTFVRQRGPKAKGTSLPSKYTRL